VVTVCVDPRVGCFPRFSRAKRVIIIDLGSSKNLVPTVGLATLGSLKFSLASKSLRVNRRVAGSSLRQVVLFVFASIIGSLSRSFCLSSLSRPSVSGMSFLRRKDWRFFGEARMVSVVDKGLYYRDKDQLPGLPVTSTTPNLQ
jgi:hypothetical protein